MNRMIKYIFISITFIVLYFPAGAQNNLCQSSLPFCTDTVYNFPAGVNAGTAQAGADYTCLYTQPNPAWYYMEVLNPGPISIYMSSTPQVDIDFSLWGPFTNQTAPCVAQLTAGTTVDCSYSTAWNETADIPNAQPGQIYILLICNYSNQPCNINFQQSNTSNPSHGTTNCGILAPPIINNGPLCEGETLEITVTNPVPNATYNWTGPNAFTSTQMNITIPGVTSAQGGTYSLSITLNGQTSPAVTTTVVVNPMPTVTLGGFNTVCTDEPDFTLQGGSPAGGTYSGTGVSNDMFSPATAGAGTHTITYDYMSPDSCGGSATATITVEDRPIIVISPDTTICQVSSATLSASGGVNYIWSNSLNMPTITVSPNVTTTYTVTVSSQTGCSESASVTVNVNPNPIITIKPLNATLCLGESIDLVAGGGSNYTWASNPADATLAGQNTLPIIVVSPITTTTYSVTATDDYGCLNTASQTVSIHPNPSAYFLANPPSVSILEPVISFIDNSYGATSYYWHIDDGTIASTPSFTHTFTDTGIFNVSLIVANQWGCKDTTAGTVEIRPNYTIYIPNTFSPNKDLKNDVFHVYGEGITEFEFRIFDRWGKQLFITDDINMGWDGKCNGVNYPEGVYVYKVVYRDGTNKRNYLWGTVSLIR